MNESISIIEKPEYEFKFGDVVRLISGGPLMTVSSNSSWDTINNQYYIHCQWFFKGELKDSVFPNPCLIKENFDEENESI